jgi:DNA-binding NtrC family response regulator
MRTLLTWSDQGAAGPRPAHHSRRPNSDTGPIVRLLDHADRPYDRVRVLTTEAGAGPARAHAASLAERGLEVEVIALPVDDPSDHAQLFAALSPVVAGLGAGEVDVLLSAGTPQAQTLWVILVQAGLLDARMLQVIPAAFVPVPHPHPVRVVSLDIPGFPEIRALRAEVDRWRARDAARGAGLIGRSAPMVALERRIGRVASSSLPVLVLGETGVGKELVARAVHGASARAGGPFIAESCASLAEGLLATELFGHEAGAFTGAVGRRRGLFELAHGGTLMLDELGELPPRVQVSLLRVLQEGVIRRVGGEEGVRVDVRVVAATHRDLGAMVRDGTFREDLYYRLRGAELRVPPLRERVDDLPALVEAFLRQAGRARLPVSREAWRALERYGWPGNVRELRSEVERWAVFCDDGVTVDDLSPEVRRGVPAPAPAASGARTLREAVEDAERAAISAALAAAGGNVSAAARALGVDRHTVARKRDRG